MFNYLEFSPFLLFCYLTTKILLYTKENSTISNTIINIHLATTVVELLMEIKFFIHIYLAFVKSSRRKKIKVKPVTRRERRKMMGKIVWMLRKGDFCFFFICLLYTYSAVPQEHSTEHIFFPKLLGWGTRQKALAPNNLSISITIYI